MLAGRVRAGPRAGAARTAEERAGGPGAARTAEGRAQTADRGGGADSRRTGAAVLAGSVRAQSARARARARTAEGRAQTADPGGVADSRRAGVGADRRTADHWGAQTADGRALVQTADAGADGRRRGSRPVQDRRRTPALGHYVLERSGRTCGCGVHPANVPVASSATVGVSPVDEAARRF